jgi:drug/metabolite transporter (DMT)-like permease
MSRQHQAVTPHPDPSASALPGGDGADSTDMLAVALAAVAALSYGASDFSGAVASKANNAMMVTIGAQTISLASLGVVLWVHPDGRFDLVDGAWGALGGLGVTVGLVMFYRALAIGPMSVAAALTALWGSALPVAAGLILGDRPGTVTLLGIGVAIPSAVLVSTERDQGPGLATLTPRDRAALWRAQAETRLLAVIAGIGFGLFFIALSRTSTEAGLYPLVGARAASIISLALVLSTTRQWAPITRSWWFPVIIAGLLDCAANASYLLAVRRGSLSWVAAISSLYPVSTVLLARLILDEKLARLQLLGMGTAAVALALVGVGATY